MLVGTQLATLHHRNRLLQTESLAKDIARPFSADDDRLRPPLDVNPNRGAAVCQLE